MVYPALIELYTLKLVYPAHDKGPQIRLHDSASSVLPYSPYGSMVHLDDMIIAQCVLQEYGLDVSHSLRGN